MNRCSRKKFIRNISKYAKEDLEEPHEEPLNVFLNLINQCLKRDEGWKEFYEKKMNENFSKDLNRLERLQKYSSTWLIAFSFEEHLYFLLYGVFFDSISLLA